MKQPKASLDPPIKLRHEGAEHSMPKVRQQIAGGKIPGLLRSLE